MARNIFSLSRSRLPVVGYIKPNLMTTIDSFSNIWGSWFASSVSSLLHLSSALRKHLPCLSVVYIFRLIMFFWTLRINGRRSKVCFLKIRRYFWFHKRKQLHPASYFFRKHALQRLRFVFYFIFVDLDCFSTPFHYFHMDCISLRSSRARLCLQK